MADAVVGAVVSVAAAAIAAYMSLHTDNEL